MSEMVERVAKAMCERAGTDWSATSEDEYAPPLINRPFWRQEARAAFEAMREPTEVMVEALVSDMRANELCWDANEGVMRRVVSKIIDEALK